MARDGNGTYTNPNPDFVSGTVISSAAVDANNAAMATALTQSIAVDGQSVITGNIPMASNKFTVLAAGTAATDSVTYGQVYAGVGVKGADLASAEPLVVGTDGNYFDVTGTTTIATHTVAVNRHYFTQFDGALTLTHHATTQDLPGEADITTAAGDVAEWQSTGANTVQCVNYTKADGTAVAGGIGIDDNATATAITIDSLEQVTIGTVDATETAKLQVRTGSAGTVTASSSGDEFVIEAAVGGGMSILTADASSSSIYFGSASDNVGALLQWNHDNDLFEVGPQKTGADIRLTYGNGATGLTIDGTTGLTTLKSTGVGVDTILDEDDLTSDDVNALATQQSIKAYVDASTAGYESTEQTITSAGSLTLAHSLSSTPTRVQLSLVCQTTEAGYSASDEVFINNHAQGNLNEGVSVVPDGTNLNLRFGSDASAFELLSKTTGASTNITNANWKLKARAYA